MAASNQPTVYGDVASHFRVKRLADLCEPDGGIQTGPFGSQLHQKDYVPIGTPIITVEHLGENRILHADIPCVTDEDRGRLSRYTLRKGDIVFSRVGSVDRRALVREEENGWLFSGRCLRVRPDRDKVDPGFLSYFFGLPAFREYVRAIAVGATMPSLNTAILSDVPVPHPPDIDEQRRIAHILGTLDDKIELNRRMSKTLEAMARALFRSWFIDFDPVRAKAEGRDPGLPKHIAELFPDRLVDSEFGEIPEGWEVKSLDQIARFQNGLALQKYRPNPGEERLPVVKIAQLRNGKADGGEWATADLKPECIINDGDVVFSWSGSLLVRIWCGGRAALNQHLFKVTSEEYPRWFFLDAILSHLPEFQRIAAGKATTMGHIQRHHLTAAMCVVPPQELVTAASPIFSALVDRSIQNDINNRLLGELCDTLLPKLISGELRLKVTERTAEIV